MDDVRGALRLIRAELRRPDSPWTVAVRLPLGLASDVRAALTDDEARRVAIEEYDPDEEYRAMIDACPVKP